MDTKFVCCIPILTVKNPLQAKAFYVNKLGFKVSFEWGDPISYLGLERDDVSIHLIGSNISRQEAGTGNISIITNEVDNYFSQCKSNGVEIIIEPADREYGLRDFGLKDMDGNVLNFGCDVG
jgi:uncharacterized glyoxalase superfamily protein PhnB